MKKFLYLVLASAFIFASCSDDEDKSEDNNSKETSGSEQTGDDTGSNTGDNSGSNTGDNSGSNTGDNSGSNTGDNSGSNTGDDTGSNTGDNSGSNTGDDTGSDISKFCNVIMGKACGYDISDDFMSNCVSVYEDMLASNSECTSQINEYYKCIGDAEVNDCSGKEDCSCIDDDVCKDKIDAATACMNENNPSVEFSDAEYNKFCDIIMGKACGENIGDEVINQCVDIYKNEVVNHPKCQTEIVTYYKCVNGKESAICSDTDLAICPDEIKNVDDCMSKNYPDSVNDEDYDYTKFCNFIMGNTCGEDVSDDGIEYCKVLYKEETDSHASCKDDFISYYNCIAALDATACEEDDVCVEEIDKASKCLTEKYPDQAIENIDFDGFCTVIMGKACGASISSDVLSQCADVYKEETKQYIKCVSEASEYYECVSNADSEICSDDSVCEASLKSYSDCVDENYKN